MTDLRQVEPVALTSDQYAAAVALLRESAHVTPQDAAEADRAAALILKSLGVKWYKPNAVQGNEFWRTQFGGEVALGLWKAHESHLIAPLAAAELIYPNRVMSTYYAHNSIAQLCAVRAESGALRAFYRVPAAYATVLYNPGPAANVHRGKWALDRREVESFGAMDK